MKLDNLILQIKKLELVSDQDWNDVLTLNDPNEGCGRIGIINIIYQQCKSTKIIQLPKYNKIKP